MFPSDLNPGPSPTHGLDPMDGPDPRKGLGDLIVIFGPTATGKSELAFHLARRIGGRVINADSIQVYRGLDAGSCKPPAQARRDVPHDLIDVADPVEPFSAGRFAREAATCIEACRAAGAIPIVAGGTGLYLRALLQGIAPMPPRDEALRQRLYDRARDSSPEALHDELRRLDPETAGRLGRRDLHRVVRALEVLGLTGVPMSRHIRENAFRPDALPALKIGLTMERRALYQRVNERVELIFRLGIVDEVRALLAAGVAPGCNAFKALGYREVLGHLRSETDLERTIDLVKRNTRRYARRQITWFRRETGAHWFQVGVGGESLEAIARTVADMHGARASGG